MVLTDSIAVDDAAAGPAMSLESDEPEEEADVVAAAVVVVTIAVAAAAAAAAFAAKNWRDFATSSCSLIMLTFPVPLLLTPRRVGVGSPPASEVARGIRRLLGSFPVASSSPAPPTP